MGAPNYDPNDPVNRAELDAYVESQKREPLAEKAEDLGNRWPWYVWTLALLGALGGCVAAAKVFL